MPVFPFSTATLRTALPAAAALLALLTLPACDRLKPAPPPSAAAVPEIVEEPAPAPAAPEPEIDPQVPALTINKSAQVTILGYHDFITGKSTNPMQINVDHFRDQMAALKDARLPVISMKDFLAWRRGEKDIPDPSIVITIDDGWKSVHTLALPVLKEFGYPFTVYLYKKFVNGGGRALVTPEVKNLMAAGGEIGSHSVSHPFPGEIKRLAKNKPPEAVLEFTRMEMKDSKQFLEDLFGQAVTTYAYPGGYNTEREQTIGLEAGYEALFTVNPARVTWDTPATVLPRYIILGNDPNDSAFRAALSFRGSVGGEIARQLLADSDEPSEDALVKTMPEPNSTVTDRFPVLEVDVSKLDGIDPASVIMKVSGFGQVPAEFDPAKKVIRYPIREALRASECQVHVTFKRAAETKPDLVSWRFLVDLPAFYLPPPAPEPEPAPAPPVSDAAPDAAVTTPAPAPSAPPAATTQQ